MELKKCSHCKIEKPISDFTKNKKDGLDNCCPDCRKLRRRNYYIKHLEKIKDWTRNYKIQRRTNRKKYLIYIYAGMKRRSKQAKRPICSKEYFYNFALNDKRFNLIFKKWVDNGNKKYLSPSIDRINNTEGYIKGNMQFIPYIQNAFKGLCETIGRENILEAIEEAKELFIVKS